METNYIVASDRRSYCLSIRFSLSISLSLSLSLFLSLSLSCSLSLSPKCGPIFPDESETWILRVQSDPDLPGPDLPEPRFTGRINFPRYGKITVFDPDIPGTPIYRAIPFPPSIPVNRGPTVFLKKWPPIKF
eukprot:sb/3474945/